MAITPDEAVASANDSVNDNAPDTTASSADTSNTRPGDQVARDVTIVVCSTCRKEDGSVTSPTPGEELFEATLAANKGDPGIDGKNIKVISVECLGNCTRRLSAAVVTEQAWTYVFGDLSIDNAPDLIEGARLMRETTNGLMPWRGRPQCLKSGMVARIPPLGVPTIPTSPLPVTDE